MANALESKWNQPDKMEGLYKSLRNLVKRDPQTESKFVEGSRNMHTLLSAA